MSVDILGTSHLDSHTAPELTGGEVRGAKLLGAGDWLPLVAGYVSS